MNYVITIDGPSASGKTSVSRDLANAMGWKWVSTGAFYRGLALVALKEKVDLSDSRKLVELAQSNIWSVEMTPLETLVLYRGQRVTIETIQEEIGMYASQVSQDPEVRKALLPLQRACREAGPVLVAEGRDCGTVVFPDAILKIYLTASSDSRALRRSLEHSGSFEVLKDLQKQRDKDDQQRAHAPLQVPPGAQVIDSSTMPREAVVQRARELVDAMLKAKNLTHLAKKP
jgi:cytidylate kinase